MMGRLGKIVVVVCSVLCIALVGLWVWSYWVAEGRVDSHTSTRGFTEIRRAQWVGSDRGELAISAESLPMDTRPSATVARVDEYGPGWSDGHAWTAAASGSYGLTAQPGVMGALGMDFTYDEWAYPADPSVGRGWKFWLKLPYWLLVLFTASPGMAWAGERWRTRRRRGAGLCATCGYDLRASAGRCPECGAAAPC